MSFREQRRSMRAGTQRIIVPQSISLPTPHEFERRRMIESALLRATEKAPRFPTDDITIKKIQRFSRVSNSIPEGVDKEKLLPFFRECLQYYTNDYVVISRNHERYYTIHEMNESMGSSLSDDYVEQRFDLDFSDGGENDQDDFQQIFPYVSRLESLGKIWSNVQPPRVMHLYDPDNYMAQNHVLDTVRIEPEFPMDTIPGSQVLIECLSVSFDVPEFEPVFCSIALYDAVSRQKLSESFHFDMCSQEILSLVPEKGFADPQTKTTRALFRISNPNPNTVLIFRAEKTLYGDPTESARPYLGAYSAKTPAKFQEVCERLGSYKQVFCWGWAPLFAESDGNLSLKEGLVTIEPFVLSRMDSTDEVIMDTLAEKAKVPKSAHTINGRLQLRVRAVGDNVALAGTIDPSYKPVQFYKTDFGANANSPTPKTPTNPAEIIREVLQFPLYWNHFHTSFYNYIFVYPLSVNFSSRASSSSCRNICIRVELRANDLAEDSDSSGLNVFGKSSDQLFKPYECTPVVYHEKVPMFQDEIKIKLPFPLHEKHHLFFTFLHIKCKPGGEKESKSTVETPVGYAWLPLCTDGIVDEDTQELPVATEYKPFYFDDRVKSRIPWVDKQRPVFSLRTKVVSSIYPQERKLLNYFSLSDLVISNPHLGDNSIDSHLASLVQCNATCLRYFPLIMNQSFRLMDCVPRETSYRIFSHLVTMITTICSKMNVAVEKKPQFLCEYVHYHFDNCQNRTPELFLLISHAWFDCIETFASTDSGSGGALLRLSWFFFDIITKSICLMKGTAYDQSSYQFAREALKTNLKSISSHFSDNIEELSSSNVNLVKNLNIHFAYFLRDLLPHFELDYLLELVDYYLRAMSIMQFQVTFITVLVDYEHYLPLNRPETFDITGNAEILDHFGKRFPLVALALQPLESLLQQFHSGTKPRPGNRIAVASMVRRILGKHDLDFRYQDSDIKSLIAFIYLPILELFVENVNLFDDESDPTNGIVDREEQRMFLIPLAYILVNIPKEVVSSWWRSQNVSKVCMAIKLFSVMFQAFQHPFVTSLNMTRRDQTRDFGDGADLHATMQREKTALAKEKAASVAVHTTIIELVAVLVDDFKQIWSKSSEDDESLSILEELLILLSVSLKCTVAESTFVCLTTFVQQVISMYPKYIFDFGSFALQDIISAILRYASYSRKDIRDAAITLFHHIITVNYWQSKQLATVKSMIILSSSQLVESVKSDDQLLQSLASLSTYIHTSMALSLAVSSQAPVAEIKARMTFIACDIYRLTFKLQSMVYLAASPDEMVTIAKIVKFVKEQLKHMETGLLGDERALVVMDIGDLSSVRMNRGQLLDPEVETLTKLKTLVHSGILGVQENLFKTMENLEGWIESEVAPVIVEAWRRVRIIIRESVYFAPNGKATIIESTDLKTYARDYLDFLNIIQNLIEDAIKFRDLDNDDDFEMTTDIHLRIANQYQDSIDIKASKLENLASLFTKRGLHAEAAMCLIKVSELKLAFLKNPEQFIAMGSDEDSSAASNVASRDASAGKLKKVASKGSLRRRLSQSSISARRHSVHLLAPPDELDTQDMISEALLGHAFSRDGAIRSLKDTLDALDKAEMFEACPEILHRLLALHQQKKDYENLCNIHERFTEIYRKIIDYQKKFRAFGTYYRVGFYGRAFKDLDRKEFVYKEPKITMLPEITDRLKRLVEKKYKQVPVVFPDSGVVDPSSLAEDKLYLQITSLEVYFNEAEDKRRITAYDRSINITQFLFETPFTESGVAQAESVVQQRKRKTIVSVERPFPYLLTRQQIIEKTEVIHSPFSIIF
eukprot:TRINITY_DN6057_c0_g1_i6.p1 TRINITY_DN6057_c0_g1~~TRINITY_DN6057_c0_g1_i6.p1  ORF type:complete len:1808 (+),score=285.15 TRINITY_DN6057_c0_g1_i6:80-5503(+)